MFIRAPRNRRGAAARSRPRSGVPAGPGCLGACPRTCLSEEGPRVRPPAAASAPPSQPSNIRLAPSTLLPPPLAVTSSASLREAPPPSGRRLPPSAGRTRSQGGPGGPRSESRRTCFNGVEACPRTCLSEEGPRVRPPAAASAHTLQPPRMNGLHRRRSLRTPSSAIALVKPPPHAVIHGAREPRLARP